MPPLPRNNSLGQSQALLPLFPACATRRLRVLLPAAQHIRAGLHVVTLLHAGRHADTLAAGILEQDHFGPVSVSTAPEKGRGGR